MASRKGNPYFQAAKVALEYMGFPHFMDRGPAIWASIHYFERGGLSLSFGRVYAIVRRLESKGSSVGATPIGENSKDSGAALPVSEPVSETVDEITISFRDDGRVEIHQGGMVVVLLIEEARDQYPFLFEEED